MATLTRRAETQEAKALVEAVVAVLEDHEASQGTRERKRNKGAQRGFERAVEAFLASLLLAARKPRGSLRETGCTGLVTPRVSLAKRGSAQGLCNKPR
jgi:hypothetical protein